MATSKVRLASGTAVRFTAAAILIAAAFLCVPRGSVQEPAPVPAQVREVLRLAIDNFKQGNYEQAAGYFEFAKVRQKDLAAEDKQDLATFSGYNATALKNREDGSKQLREADDAIKAGRMQDAARLLGALNSNQHLSNVDKLQVATLNKQVQANAPVAGANPAPKNDGKSLLASGRSALQAGDLESAESYATQAEKANSLLPTWMQPWSDSPAKLRRDVQAARAKLQPVAKAEVREESSWLPKWMSGPTALVTKKDEPQKKDETASTSKSGGFWPFGSDSKNDDLSTNAKLGMARQMVKDGFLFLQMGDVDKAQLIATEAKMLGAQFTPNEPTPDLLLHEIQRKNGGVAKTDVTPKEVPKADPNVKKLPDLPKNADARAMLKHGRMLLQNKQYEEADKVCTQALNAPARWGVFEDNPEKLRKAIVDARKTNERDDSVKVLADARKLFAQGKHEEAEKKAYQAQKMHGPYGAFDFGDRPDKLLEEINRAKQAKGRDLPNNNNDALAKGPRNPLDEIPPPLGVQSANKNRVIVMVREARELERRGMLVEAKQKALEARAFRVAFGPDEDSPEHVLVGLAAGCERQIGMHLSKAVEVFQNTSDPQRSEKAQQHLFAARTLALAFQLDTGRIDQTAHQLAQVAAGMRPITNVQALFPAGQDPTKVDLPTGDPKADALRKSGRDKLEHARKELQHGKYAQARKMAEELFNPAYGLQDEVLKLVRLINAEETNQQITEALRNFDVGVDALVARDYKKALFIFQSIDPMLLPEQRQARMRDIMSMREMQPQFVATQTGDKTLIKGGRIDEKKTPYDPPVGRDDDLLGAVRAQETVAYQALRQRGFDALRKANELWKDKQPEEAIRTLKNYIDQVNLAQLETAKTNDLRRLVEPRIQQYGAMQAEKTLAQAEEKSKFVMFHNESGSQEKIRKQQAELATWMKEAHELYKQGKLKDAEAKARQVLEVDRENGAALMMMKMAETRRKQETWDREEHGNWKNFEDLLTHSINPRNVTDERPVGFDPNITGRRKPSDGSVIHELKDLKERAIQYRLRQPISLHFKDVPLKQAIKDLAVSSGVQVVADDLELQKARINMDSPLSISVENIDMKFALNILLRPLQLTYIIEDQVLKITTENRTVGRLVRVTYPIADLIVPVEDHPLPDVFNIQKALERSMNTGGYMGANFMTPPPYAWSNGTPVSSHDKGLGGAFGSQSPGTHGGALPSQGKTKEDMARVLKELIVNTIAKDKWEEMGGNGNIQYFPMGLALVINQSQEVQEEVQLLLATLRKLQDLQVSVELRAVLVSETFFERIGVDFDMNIRTPTSRTEPNLVTGNFVPAPFINRIGSGLNLVSGLTPAGTLTPDLNIPIRNSTFNFTTPQFGGYQPEAGLSLGLAFLSDIQVFMFLEAVQGDRRAHIMQAPKISVYNGQTATIGGLMIRPTVQNVIPLPMANGSLVMVPNITPMPFGLTMTVQPVVSPDRRFIRLNVTPNLIAGGIPDPAGAIILAVPSGTIGTFDGNIQQPPFQPGQQINASVTINPQQTNLFLANTTVNVPDGGTVLLGGFKFLAEERTEYGPPILSKIPYLSRLFRNVGWSRDGSTLIYLVTARVIMIEEEEAIFMGSQAPIPGR